MHDVNVWKTKGDGESETGMNKRKGEKVG